MLHRLSTAALLVVLLVPLTACDGWPLQSKAAAEAPPWQNEHAGDSSVQGTSLNAAIHRAAGGQCASKFVVTGSIYDPRQIWYVGEAAQ